MHITRSLAWQMAERTDVSSKAPFVTLHKGALLEKSITFLIFQADVATFDQRIAKYI
jgi:hypothetical protein